MSDRTVKFALTIEMLASASGSIQDRLLIAVFSNGILFLDRDFSENDLRKKYMNLREGLQNIKELSSDEASELISKIVSMYCEICKRDC